MEKGATAQTSALIKEFCLPHRLLWDSRAQLGELHYVAGTCGLDPCTRGANPGAQQVENLGMWAMPSLLNHGPGL